METQTRDKLVSEVAKHVTLFSVGQKGQWLNISYRECIRGIKNNSEESASTAHPKI
jgi:hypothetical protein